MVFSQVKRIIVDKSQLICVIFVSRQTLNHDNQENQKNHNLSRFFREFRQFLIIMEQTIINDQYKYSELTSKIIGCAMTVHSILGNCFQEVIYQRAMAIEMRLAGISFTREYDMPVFSGRNRSEPEELTF